MMLALATINGRNLMRKLAVVATIASGLLLSGCGGEETFTAKGQFQLAGAPSRMPNCEGQGGYSDIGSTTNVEVSNASGEVIAVSDLGPGVWDNNYGCVFNIVVEGIPAGEKLYKIEVANRGAVTKTQEDLSSGELRIGVGHFS